MQDTRLVGTDLDYAAYLARVGPDNLEDAVTTCVVSLRTVQEYFGGIEPARRDKTKHDSKDCSPLRDYFAFYQEGDLWAWRRVTASDTIVAKSRGGFDHYSECVADARLHGWTGTPITNIGLLIGIQAPRRARRQSSRKIAQD